MKRLFGLWRVPPLPARPIAVFDAASALAREGARQRKAASKALIHSKARAMRAAFGLPALPALEPKQ